MHGDAGDPSGASGGAGASRPSLAARLRRARHAGFVGRDAELGWFRASLGAEPGAAPVRLLHGPGGIGKTALLDRFARDAEAAGHGVLRIDAAALDPDAPLAGLGATLAVPARPVVLVDGADVRPDLEPWLREDFLPGLPEQAVVVVAGRHRPGPEWSVDPGWRELVRVHRLTPLDDPDAAALLEQRGVPPRRRPALLAFAAGHPLALSLAADEVAGDTPHQTGHQTGAAWQPGRQVVATLLERILEPPPDTAHALALCVCAHVRHTTLDVLRRVLSDAESVGTFGWLSGLSYVEPGPHGLRTDDLVRRLVGSEHRWSDPQGYELLHRTLWHHLGERALEAHGEVARAAVGDLVHLQRYRDPRRDEGGELLAADDLVALDAGADLAPMVRELADVHLGAAGRAVVDHWLERQPEAFTVYARRGAARPASFFAWLRLTAPEADDLAADPVAAAAWAHLEQGGALRPDEEIGLARFVVPRPRAEHLAATDPRMHALYDTLFQRTARLAASYVALATPGPCVPFMTGLDHPLHAEVAAGDLVWGVFAHDWRQVPLARHLERSLPQVGVVHDDVEEAEPAMSRAAFDEAVRQALRDCHDEEALGANPLVRAGFAADRVPGDPVASLRAAVEDAVTALGEDPRRSKAHRAVATTYLLRAATQEAAAARLGIPFSTYRRHLGKGVALVCDRLWSQAQGHV